MKPTAFTLLALSLALTACGKKDDAGKAAPSGGKPAEATAAQPAAQPAAAPAMTELDLTPAGDAFKGYVASVPAGAKLEVDGASIQITLSDVDFVSIGDAPYWADGVKGLASDKDNSNIKQVSDTEVRWERNPPLGKSWLVDILVKAEGAQFSCGTGMTGTFTSAAMADQIAGICKSIHKK